MLAAPFAALSFSARSAPLDPPTHAKRHRVHLREATVWASERASNVSKGLHSSSCPCDDPALCEPVSGPPLRSKEIFGFGTGSPEPTDLDWSRVTTIAWAGANTTVTCLAHRHGVRIVLAAPSPESVFDKSAAIKAKWVADAVAAVTASHLDGIVFDWESPCPVGSPLQKAYAELVAATRAALRRLSPSYQVTICVAWSPDDIDGRGYDIPAFAAAADALYIMDYDTRSQIFDACIAAANAPLPGTLRGMSRYFDLGVAPSQLILGVPWYGYRYPCAAGTPADARFCPIAEVPFRGVNCSDAAGSEIGYASLLPRLAASTTGAQWDANQGANYFNTVEGGVTVQYWYDDARSLRPKYAAARKAGLRGVGPFEYGDVPPSHEDVWAAFDAFLLP